MKYSFAVRDAIVEYVTCTDLVVHVTYWLIYLFIYCSTVMASKEVVTFQSVLTINIHSCQIY